MAKIFQEDISITFEEVQSVFAEYQMIGFTVLLSLLVVAVMSTPTEAFSSKFVYISKARSDLLEDLEHPFRLHEKFPAQSDEEKTIDLSVESDTIPDVTHFCFLIHGHRGLSRDLKYLQAVLERFGDFEQERIQRRWIQSQQDACDSDRLQNSDRILPPRQRLVVHNCLSNEGKTHDGVAAGGDRVVAEMLDTIRSEMSDRPSLLGDSKEPLDITISILGNSLGGLFGRYAIAKLVERHGVCQESSSHSQETCWILDEKYRLHLNVFCSTASPHLGVANHTYFSVPRPAEVVVAHAMGDTGRDLFRLNDLVRTMATCPSYLGPLSSFRKRIAVANVHNTDFPVPTNTAAFLSVNSTYPHMPIAKSKEDCANDESGKKSMIVATFHTPSEDELNSMINKEMKEDREEEQYVERHVDELHEMSESLDKLGWKKVFVDLRDELPSIKVPRIQIPFVSKENETVDFESLKNSGRSVSSMDISAVVGQKDNRVSVPLGHNMIVAFSRSPLSTYMNRGGRSIVDNLAQDLARDIFSWSTLSDERSKIPNI